MDSQYLVDEAIDEGDRLWRELDKLSPVKCAFWVLSEREGANWSLQIASDHFSDANLQASYAEVADIIQRLGLKHVPLTIVRLVHGSERIVRDVINVRIPYPGDLPLRCPVSQLGGNAISAAILYALPDSAPRVVEKVTWFSAEEQGIIDRLHAHGINVSVHRLGEQYFSGRARYAGDNRDPQVTYGETKLDVLNKLAALLEVNWSDLLASSTSP